MTQDQARAVIGASRVLTLDRLDARLPEARPVLRLLATFADAQVPTSCCCARPSWSAARSWPGPGRAGGRPSRPWTTSGS
jgi:hypothetical protein